MAEYKNIQRHMQRLAVTLHPSTERHVSLAGGMMACLEEFEESVLALTLSQQDKSKSQGKSGLSESEEDGVDLHADDRMPMEDVEALFGKIDQVGRWVDQ